MNDVTTATAHKDAEILIERARSLIPALRQRSKQATAERRLPQETIDDFRRLGLTRCLQPSDVRRLRLRLPRVLQNAPHAGAGLRLVGLGRRRARRAQLGGRQFSENARSARCGTAIPTPSRRRAVAPNGSAEIVAGGHRLSGRWGFASGCDHAQWFLLGSMTKGGGEPEARMFLVPSE